GGAGIAACCDIRIGTEATRIGFQIARTLGNCLSMSNISRLGSLIGSAPTKDLIFKARLVEAPEALALGLLNEVVPDVATLQRRANETAKLVAGNAPITLEVTKEAVRRIRRTLSREEGEDLILRAYMSEDFREGMDAFLNKRTPTFKAKKAIYSGSAPPSESHRLQRRGLLELVADKPHNDGGSTKRPRHVGKEHRAKH